MLKNILSLLLSKFYSKKESALVASLALPDKSVSTSVSVTSGRDEYVAPNDGYLEFITTVPNNGINLYGQVLQTSNYPREGRAAKLFVPIAKGKKIIFEVAADTSVTFYALVGVWGGVSTLKKLILQGGGLCLNSLSSSLRRSSLSIRKDKSLLSLHQFSINTRSTRQVTTAPTNGATLSQLPSTDGSELKEIVQALCTLMSALIQTLCDKASTDRADLYRVFAEYLRAAKSITCSRLAGRYLCGAFFLSRVTAPQLNVANGGASC